MQVENQAQAQAQNLGGTPLNELPLAQAYVPKQTWRGMYSCKKEGTIKGTIFPCLYRPYEKGWRI